MTSSIGILGGGAAGVCIAEHLANNRNIRIDLLERSTRLGGLHHSLNVNGQYHDIGSFIFNLDHELIATFPFLREILIPVHPSHCSLSDHGHIDTYPFTITGYLKEHGAGEFILSGLDFFLSKGRYRRRDTVPAFASYYMGKRIYEKGGIATYIERLYGMVAEEVGIDFARQRLLNIEHYSWKSVVSALLPPLIRRRIDRKAPPLLIPPPSGFGSVYDAIDYHLQQRGVSVRKGIEIVKVERSGDRFEVWTEGGERIVYDRIISTIPIPLMLRLLGDVPNVRIDTMTLLSLFCEAVPLQQWDILCNFTRTGSWKRMVNHSSLFGTEGDNRITVEITMGRESTTDTGIESLCEEFLDHVTRYRLFAQPPTILQHHITPNAYPRFHHGDQEQIASERARLRQHGVEIVGRQGSFSYHTSSQVAAEARNVAEEMQGNLTGSP